MNEMEYSNKYKELMSRFRNLEKEYLLQGIENEKLERNIKELKKEIDTYKKIPQILATVVDRLEEDKVAIKGTVGHTLIVGYPESIDEKLLIPGAIEEKPDAEYGDIGGLESQITEIKETVELPLKHPEIFEEIGIDPPKGILLQGPPGTGKTLLAKAVANETNATFIKLVASEFVNKFLGEGARYVREVFELAREKTPAIIFIDEIDAIGTRRTESHTGGEREVHRTLMQLLSELDGFDQRGDAFKTRKI